MKISLYCRCQCWGASRVGQNLPFLPKNYSTPLQSVYGGYVNWKWSISNFSGLWLQRSHGWQNGSDPFISKKKIVRIIGFIVFKLTGLDSRFQRKNRFEKFAPSPKIFIKKCQKSAFQTKPAKFDTFWPICLCWNCESEPVDLTTMNPIIRIIFFHL